MIGIVKAQVQVNAPFSMLWERYLPLFLEQGLNPEIGLDASSLDCFSQRDFAKVADMFHKAGLSITLHAPFQDLVPGALDAKILAASRSRLQDAFDQLDIFQARSIVCHIGYESRHYQWLEDRWLDHSIGTWAPLADQAARQGTLLTLENVYETEPQLIKELLTRLRGVKVGFCLDVGHLQAFGGGDFQGWLETLGPLVGQLHLHDNHGVNDDHLALGAGIVPFPGILAYFTNARQRPIITLEPHHENSLQPSLTYLAAHWPW